MSRIDLPNELIPNDAEFERMKDNLFLRIDADDAPVVRHVKHVPPRKNRKRSPKQAKRRRWVGLIAAAAVVGITTTLLATGGLGPRTASAEAAEFLRSAADATMAFSDPVVGAGQYLAVDSTEVALSFSEDWAYESKRHEVLYVPEDRSSLWVHSSQALPPGKMFGDLESAQADIERWGLPGRGDVVLRAGEGGKFIELGDMTGPSLAALPTDPTDLLAYLYEHAEGSSSKDEAVFVKITDLLRTGVVPAKLRAAMYEAIARVPGVYISDGQANLEGRKGVAISRQDPFRSWTDEIIVDPATGLVIGMRSKLVRDDRFVPAGTVIVLTAVTTSVVDEAPAGPYREEQPSG